MRRWSSSTALQPRGDRAVIDGWCEPPGVAQEEVILLVILHSTPQDFSREPGRKEDVAHEDPAQGLTHDPHLVHDRLGLERLRAVGERVAQVIYTIDPLRLVAINTGEGHRNYRREAP